MAGDTEWLTIPASSLAGILASSGEIIVAMDTDCWYPEAWLNNVLKPFKDPSVVAVTSTGFVNAPAYTPF
ncbi:MAG: glycosyltransferase family A protein [Candidatus Bathyarchaeia archaeon]